MRQPEILLMVGVPGSGKSTLLAKMIQKRDELDYKYHVASSDDLIEAYAKSQGKTYSEVFAEYIGKANHMFERGIKEAAKNGLDIIVDRTNISRSSRAKVMSLVPGFYFRTAVVVGTPPREVLDARLSNRPGKFIPSGVIDRFLTSYVEPTYEEGFNHIMHYPYEEKGA